MLPKSVIILRALLDGWHIKVGGGTYALSESHDLIVKVVEHNGEIPDDEWVIVFMGGCSLADFIHWCEAATDDEVSVIGFNLGLNMK
jgi:hypothetical protein